jgi:hypothetical protein
MLDLTTIIIRDLVSTLMSHFLFSIHYVIYIVVSFNLYVPIYFIDVAIGLYLKQK